MIVPEGGFFLPSNRVPGVEWFWMKLIPALQELNFSGGLRLVQLRINEVLQATDPLPHASTSRLLCSVVQKFFVFHS